jgi:hypothetical protein
LNEVFSTAGAFRDLKDRKKRSNGMHSHTITLAKGKLFKSTVVEINEGSIPAEAVVWKKWLLLLTALHSNEFMN